MATDDNGKYVHLGSGYDKDWLFIKDDKELELWKQDGSLTEREYIVEVKRVFRVKNEVTTKTILEEVK